MKRDDVFFIIEPIGERTFELYATSRTFDSADGSTPVSIRCRWENTRRPFLINRYVKINTTVKKIKDLREATLAGKV
jgi:hypothetical protein